MADNRHGSQEVVTVTKIKSLHDLADLRAALKKAEQEAAERAERERAEAARLERERNLFSHGVGRVSGLPGPGWVPAPSCKHFYLAPRWVLD